MESKLTSEEAKFIVECMAVAHRYFLKLKDMDKAIMAFSITARILATNKNELDEAIKEVVHNWGENE